MSDSGAPASTSAAATASVRGVAFGWAKVAVSMTMPGHQLGGQRAVVEVERHAEPRGEQRDHLAGRGAGGVDPVGVAGARRSRRGGRSTTRGSRANSSRVALGDRADPLEGAAVADDEQVVVDVGSGSVRNRVDAGQEVVERRHRIGADRRRERHRCARRAGRPRASRRACRRRGSRGRRRGRAGPAVSRSTTVAGTVPSQGARSIIGVDAMAARRHAASAARPGGPRSSRAWRAASSAAAPP